MCAATVAGQKLTKTRCEQIGHMLCLLRMSVVVPSVPGNQLSKDFRHRDSNTGRWGEGRVSQPARLWRSMLMPNIGDHTHVHVMALAARNMSSPGVEPGLSRPQRDVLTTRRWGPDGPRVKGNVMQMMQGPDLATTGWGGGLWRVVFCFQTM